MVYRNAIIIEFVLFTTPTKGFDPIVSIIYFQSIHFRKFANKQLILILMKAKNKEYVYPDHELDNHANQLNPNNDEYYNSRGESK